MTEDAILEDCLQAFPHVRLRVTGVCMRPSLEPGDAVRIAPRRALFPRLGDVVLVRTAEGLRLHRLVWPPRLAASAVWRTKPDRSPWLDAPLPHAAVLGTVVGLERDGRERAIPAGGSAWVQALFGTVSSRLRVFLRRSRA